MKLTAKRLHELLHYDPKTGIFTWLVDLGKMHLKGKQAGQNSDRYIRIRIDYRMYLAHRLAWLYMTGKWPKGEIDHRDGIKTNNCFDNIRDVTRSINGQNTQRARKDNKLGILGVSKRGNKFSAQIKYDNKNRCIGLFDTPEKAQDAYLAAKRKHHKGCMI